MMESGAILLYLSDKTGQLAGDDPWVTMEWLMLQMASVGPMLGQANHFLHFNSGNRNTRKRGMRMKRADCTVFSIGA
ncbi:MAG: hypothetical protein CM1200mP9_08830 [Gammaproteobacteria bacterium]|nr:MAG: hypothetical protein CM1200mP9_08830 [Gammaproteobacteria bacterium]